MKKLLMILVILVIVAIVLGALSNKPILPGDEGFSLNLNWFQDMLMKLDLTPLNTDRIEQIRQGVQQANPTPKKFP